MHIIIVLLSETS